MGSILKKTAIYVRASIRFMILISIAVIIIIGIVSMVYKPLYSVSLDGEIIGYTENKSELQKKINKYIETGNEENVAFVEVDELPEYKLCLLKKDIVPNDDEIYSVIENTGQVYYKYYAITKESEEIAYLSTFDEAEKAIEENKQKKSAYTEYGCIEKYGTEKKEFATIESVVEKMYIEPVVVKDTNKSKPKTVKVASSGKVNTSKTTSSQKVSIGIALIKPISGTITSRFGRRSSGTHTGLDIAASSGTPIKAASGGTVTFSGWKGNLGNLVVISHGNGIQTYYAHCSSIDVKTGQTVSGGEVIAKVGSTGNSTGPHLHLEVRINGVAQNPQNYVY